MEGLKRKDWILSRSDDDPDQMRKHNIPAAELTAGTDRSVAALFCGPPQFSASRARPGRSSQPGLCSTVRGAFIQDVISKLRLPTAATLGKSDDRSHRLGASSGSCRAQIFCNN